MLTFTNEVMRDLLAKSLDTASFHNGQWRDPSTGGGSPAGDYVEWLTIKDLAKSVVADVTRIRNHPLVPARITLHGYIYNVSSGKLVEVPEAESMGETNGTKRAAAGR
jgi:carbonic anhydrase